MVMIAGFGLLWAGPCSITTLQLQDFIRTTTIQTVVATAFAAIESAITAAAQQPDASEL